MYLMIYNDEIDSIMDVDNELTSNSQDFTLELECLGDMTHLTKAYEFEGSLEYPEYDYYERD